MSGDKTGGFYKGITGQRRTKQTTRGMLADAKAAYGTWKKVAENCDISERTLRRLRAVGGKWTASKSTREKLDELGKQKEVRRAGIKSTKMKKLDQAAKYGARIKIKANQGPKAGGGGDYKRPRQVDFNVPAEAMKELLDAYEDGQDASVREIMEDMVRDYGWSDWAPPGGWEFGSVDSFDWEPH